MAHAVSRLPANFSSYSNALRARFFIVPSDNNPTLQLPTPDEEKQLIQTLQEIRKYAESRREPSKTPPVCFLSFVHGKHDELVSKIADYLEIAGITVYADIGGRNEKLKLDRASYLQKAVLEKWDFVIVIGSPEYLSAYKQFKEKQN
jgi:hypothetical protein